MGIDEQSQAELSAAMSDQNNLIQALEIPPGLPFDQPEHKVITWDVALNADELIGLLGTFSWVILMEDEARQRLFETARRVLRDALGVSGDATVDVAGHRRGESGRVIAAITIRTRCRRNSDPAGLPFGQPERKVITWKWR